ncbi:MAG: DUF2157 domain-containing protein [Cyanobacteria bacterium J06639_1]
MSGDNTFRRQLDRSLNDWVNEGLIEVEQRDRLRSYYRLDELPAAATSKFAAVLLTIGGLLIGLGIVTFVAANWAAIPRSVRALGVLMLTLGFNTAGFFWWTTDGEHLRLRPRVKTLGSAMLLVGQLGWGASIALMAQWVQIDRSPAGLFAIWGGTVLLMAFGLRHTVSAALGTVLIAIAHCAWALDFNSADWIELSMPFAAFWASALLVGLAYWCRSRWVFALSLIACGLIVWLGDLWMDWNIYVSSYEARGGYSSYEATLDNAWTWLLVSWCALLWGGSVLHQHYLKPSRRTDEVDSSRDGNLDFAPTAQLLGVLPILVVLTISGFRFVAHEQRGWNMYSDIGLFSGILLSPITGTFILMSLAIATYGWAVLWQRRQQFQPSELVMHGAVAIALAGCLMLKSGVLAGWSLVVFANVLLFVVAATLAWQGLQLASRWRFWVGLLSLTLQILIRFFEYDTGLLLKSLVLVVCGIGVVAAGLKFERSVYARRLPGSKS